MHNIFRNMNTVIGFCCCFRFCSQRCGSVPQRGATYLMRTFLNGWLWLEELPLSCWLTQKSCSSSYQPWRLTCTWWRTTGVFPFSLIMVSGRRLSFFCLPSAVPRQSAPCCPAQSHVLMGVMMFPMTYKVSPLVNTQSLSLSNTHTHVLLSL